MESQFKDLAYARKVYNAAVARGLKSGDLLQLFLLIHVHISFILKIIHSKNVVFDYFNVVLPNFQRNFVLFGCVVPLMVNPKTPTSKAPQPARGSRPFIYKRPSFSSTLCANRGSAHTWGR